MFAAFWSGWEPPWPGSSEGVFRERYRGSELAQGSGNQPVLGLQIRHTDGRRGQVSAPQILHQGDQPGVELSQRQVARHALQRVGGLKGRGGVAVGNGLPEPGEIFVGGKPQEKFSMSASLPIKRLRA